MTQAGAIKKRKFNLYIQLGIFFTWIFVVKYYLPLVYNIGIYN